MDAVQLRNSSLRLSKILSLLFETRVAQEMLCTLYQGALCGCEWLDYKEEEHGKLHM